MNEVEKEPVLVWQIVGQESQRLLHAFNNLRRLAITTLVANAQAGQAESRGGDTGHHP